MKTVLTVRMDPELKAQLGMLAKATDRTSSYLVAEAVKEYLDVQAWQIEALKEGLRQVAAATPAPPNARRAKKPSTTAPNSGSGPGRSGGS